MVYILLFATSAATVLFLMMALAAEVPITARGRLQNLGDVRVGGTSRTLRAADAPFSDRVFRPFLRRFSTMAEKLGMAGDARIVQEKLEQAGRPKLLGVMIGAKEYIALKLLCLILAVAAFLLLYRFPIVGGIEGLACAAIVAIVLAMAPTVTIDHMVQARKAMVQKSMSDTLDLLVVSAEAGLSLDAAMTRVAQKRTGPLPDEFEYALQEMRLGKPRSDSLRGIARRTGVSEVKMFTTSLIQAENLGVSIAQVLRTQADTQRERRSQRIREQAAKLPVKMMFPLIFFIMPAIFVVLAYPGFVEILRGLSGAR